MKTIHVNINKKEIPIDAAVFSLLLDHSSVKEGKIFKEALESEYITLHNLKSLAIKSDIPFALFFASKEICDLQIEDMMFNLNNKVPSKDHVFLNSRGKINLLEVRSIIYELIKKQTFLKQRILTTEKPNEFIGCINGMIKKNFTVSEIAETVRDFFNIDLKYLRKLSKEKVFKYLCEKLENKNILVSVSAYQYMAQNISPKALFSGLCIADNKFPYIFINTREGDELPLILETAGRQIFTLITMLVCIGMKKYVLEKHIDTDKFEIGALIYKIAGEILIPEEDCETVKIYNYGDLVTYSNEFKVTPSMLLMRFWTLRLITKIEFDKLLEFGLKERELVLSEENFARSSPEKSYEKYNGKKFVKEVIKAFKDKKITTFEVTNALFKRGNKSVSLVLKKFIMKY